MLTPRKRISKKELKQDKLVTFYAQLQDWLNENTKLVYGALGALVILIVGISVFSNMQENAQTEASVGFANATQVYQAGDYSNAITAFSTLVSEYGNTPSGKLAQFYLADSFYKTGDYNNAQTHYKAAISALKGQPHFVAAAKAGVAACMEQNGEYEAAAEAYEKVVSQHKGIPLAPRYLLRAARCYTLANNAERATDLYTTIINDYPDSNEKSDAVMLKALL